MTWHKSLTVVTGSTGKQGGAVVPRSRISESEAVKAAKICIS